MGITSTHVQSILARRFNAVLAKRGGLALAVTGEAGIGKSFGVTQALNEISVQHVQLHANSNLEQWVKAVPKAKKLPAWAQLMLEKPEAGDAFVNAFVANMALLAPFVLHLEDVHEAKPERLALIEILGRAASRTKGVALVVTSRRLVPAGFSSFELLALEPAQSKALLEQTCGAALPIESLDYVFARAQGNPLFTLEFFKYLTRHGMLWFDGTTWHWRAPKGGFVPVTIEALIEQMIASLNQSLESGIVLEARAVLPVQMLDPQQLWFDLTKLNRQAFSDTLELLEREGLLRDGDFAHPLIREVVQNGISSVRRAELARLVLQHLAESPDESQLQLAASFVADAGLPAAEQLTVLQKAAAQAQAQNNPRLEAAWLLQSLECAASEDRADLAMRAAKLLKKFNLRETIRVASIAVNLKPNDATAVYLLATTKATAGELLEAEALIAQLPKDTQSSEFGLKQHLIVRSNGDDQAGAYDIWQQMQTGGYTIDAQIANQAVQTVYLHGDIGQALELADLAMNTLELETHNRAMMLIDFYARYYFEQGDYDKAEQQISKAIELLRTQDDPRILALAIANRGIVRGSLNRELEAIEDFKEAANKFAEVGLTLKFAECLNQLGTTYSNLGDFAQAERVLLEARDILRPSEIIYSLAKCESSLANLYSNWLPPYGASLTLKHARAALNYARGLQNPVVFAHYLSVASIAEAGHGDPKKALEYAQELIEIAQKLKNPRVEKMVQHAYGMALSVNGKPDQALSALAKVIEIERETQTFELSDTILLEIDRISQNVESVRAKIEQYRKNDQRMLLTLAERYFPGLVQPQSKIEVKTPHTPALGLLVLGPFGLTKLGQTVAYRGRKRAEFLLYLLETRIAGRTEASTEELIETLYPDLLDIDAKASLKQLVYLLRQQFGSNVIQSTSNGYALEDVESDIEEFFKTGDATLWRGKYLAGISNGWIPSVTDALIHALQAKVEMLSTTDAKEAGRLGKILLELEPYDLDALELTLRALTTTSENPKRLYLELRERFLEVGEDLPDTIAGFLAQRESKLETRLSQKA
jgi:tetratricopeptide (TPR) repeat protein